MCVLLLPLCFWRIVVTLFHQYWLDITLTKFSLVISKTPSFVLVFNPDNEHNIFMILQIYNCFYVVRRNAGSWNNLSPYDDYLTYSATIRDANSSCKPVKEFSYLFLSVIYTSIIFWVYVRRKLDLKTGFRFSLRAVWRWLTHFWGVEPCSLVDVYRHFRGTCRLHYQGVV